MRHDNIHFSLPNGAIFSIASLNGSPEVAVLTDDGFVPVSEWYGEYDDDVLPLDGSATSLARALGAAVAWAEREKARLLAQALDQAL